MLVAKIGSPGFKVLLLLHILAVIVGFAPAFVRPFLSARLKGEGSSLAENPRVANFMARGVQQVYGPAIAVAGLLGIGLVLMSSKAYEFSQAWVSIAFLLWIAILGVVFAALVPAEKKVAAGDADEEKHVAMFGGIVHLLLVLMLIDMIWRFGA